MTPLPHTSVQTPESQNPLQQSAWETHWAPASRQSHADAQVPKHKLLQQSPDVEQA